MESRGNVENFDKLLKLLSRLGKIDIKKVDVKFGYLKYDVTVIPHLPDVVDLNMKSEINIEYSEVTGGIPVIRGILANESFSYPVEDTVAALAKRLSQYSRLFNAVRRLLISQSSLNPINIQTLAANLNSFVSNVLYNADQGLIKWEKDNAKFFIAGGSRIVNNMFVCGFTDNCPIILTVNRLDMLEKELRNNTNDAINFAHRVQTCLDEEK
jgi:hypothetical protein